MVTSLEDELLVHMPAMCSAGVPPQTFLHAVVPHEYRWVLEKGPLFSITSAGDPSRILIGGSIPPTLRVRFGSAVRKAASRSRYTGARS